MMTPSYTPWATMTSPVSQARAAAHTNRADLSVSPSRSSSSRAVFFSSVAPGPENRADMIPGLP